MPESSPSPSEVSIRLAEQAVNALAELLRGSQVEGDPEQVQAGLLTVMLGLVVVIYAEDHGLLADDPMSTSTSIRALFERLHADADSSADPIDQRVGAWPELRDRFRRIFTRHGGPLFDPDEPAFSTAAPPIRDGTIHRVLRDLLILDGEPVAYRTLDVEHIGSVYESMMGFDVERASGVSLGLKPLHVVVDLEALLRQAPARRSQWLIEQANCKLPASGRIGLAEATTLADVLAVLQRRVSERTPTCLPAGSLVLQPNAARRRTGSHYTPRSLTEPIVRTALQPLLADLGETPNEAQILALKICDPAMGSGAFLIEACRQLAEVLVRAWDPPGSDKLALARQRIAEHCLYGVDKNPVAVTVAKHSLWLVAHGLGGFARLNHALKCGDSLVGLTREQIAEFRWDNRPRVVQTQIQTLADARLQADAVIATFFAAETDRHREALRTQRWKTVERWHAGDLDARAELEAIVVDLQAKRGLRPFHWEIEFPEVFGPGYSAMIGNPPFLGGRSISTEFGSSYLKLLVAWHPGASGGTDLSGFFFRRAFDLLAPGGTFGLIATNTIAQGDTRAGSLEPIVASGGSIYHAQKRRVWPGCAAILVSVVHVRKGPNPSSPGAVLDGRPVARISAFLMPSGPDALPKKLGENRRTCFQGNIVLGEGFTFEDHNEKATPIADMATLIANDPKNAQRIFPFLGGREVTEDPLHLPRRHVINFAEMTESEAQAWPDLYAIVRSKVMPERAVKNSKKYPRMVHEWWKFWNFRDDLVRVTQSLRRVLVVPLIAKHLSLCFLPNEYVVSHKLAVFAFEGHAAFCVLQSQSHEGWARLFSSTLGDGLNYSPTDCFETFPFPAGWQSNAALESAGRVYYEFRAALMIRNDEGLTKTYNRFHDPDERDPDNSIRELRELHAALDQALLTAYGWADLAAQATCEFELEHEHDQDDRRQKPWRCRWPREFQDQVLARLLELNAVRAEQERLATHAEIEPKPARPRPSRRAKPVAKQTSLRLGDE